jgi:hypothetical protein
MLTAQQNILGLVPGDCREGDLVCIVYGCSVPVILRQVSTEESGRNDHFVLVGEAYIHGMMDGEALVMKKRDDIRSQRFALR